MIIGVPTEIKTKEFRVGMTPSGVAVLKTAGHKVLIEKGAGNGSGLTDDEYKAAGAELVSQADVWGKSDMVVKVKEPIAPEYALMRPGMTLFTYLHLAACQELGHELIKRKVNSVAYETIETADGKLPLLTPMSAVAGRMAVQAGASLLEKERGGRGVLLGGVPGVRRGRIVILGGGIVGANACKMAVGLGADVTVLDINQDVLAYLDDIYQGRINTLYSDPISIRETVLRADLVIGGVLIAGARAPRLVTEAMVKEMLPGSVIVDVAVDQGGCVETIHATTHENPTYVVHDVIHYGVANMPGAVPRTSTYALTNATLPYVKALAKKGLDQAAKDDAAIYKGINTYQGAVPHPAVAESLGVTVQPIKL